MLPNMHCSIWNCRCSHNNKIPQGSPHFGKFTSYWFLFFLSPVNWIFIGAKQFSISFCWTFFRFQPKYVTQGDLVDVLLTHRKENSPPMKNLIFWDMTQLYRIAWSEEKELFRACRPFSAWEIAFCFSIVFDHGLFRFFSNSENSRKKLKF